MKLSKKTIQAFANIIIGNASSPYMRRVDLEDFFFRINGKDPLDELANLSRVQYTEEMLKRFNDTSLMDKVFNEYFEPVNFVGTSTDINEIANALNPYLKYDGFELVLISDEKLGLKDLSGMAVGLDLEELCTDELSDGFINAQLYKCEQKIISGDFDGAITNARTLIERVFIKIIDCVTGQEPDNDGDLIRLYKRTQQVLNLDPSRKDISDALKQILNGLSSIVNGLAAMRNKMSDAHATTYKPSKHHAKLAVNSAKTLVDFIFETYQYQLEKGMLKEKNKSC